MFVSLYFCLPTHLAILVFFEKGRRQVLVGGSEWGVGERWRQDRMGGGEQNNFFCLLFFSSPTYLSVQIVFDKVWQQLQVLVLEKVTSDKRRLQRMVERQQQ